MIAIVSSKLPSSMMQISKEGPIEGSASRNARSAGTSSRRLLASLKAGMTIEISGASTACL